ncbi:MAG: mannonate dehydratase [Chloroflexota bacterium]
MKLKLSVSISPRADEDELLFVKQLGAECVYTWVSDDHMDVVSLTELRQKVNDAGLVLHNVGNMGIGKCDQIQLALPGRDEKIKAFKQFLRNLSAAGIYITTFTWEQAGVWSSENRGSSRGAPARRVEMHELEQRPFTHGRAYSEEEIWDNFAYFMRQIIPVAEETGVRLALHPNDPPVPVLGGVPCLIHNFGNYKRAFEIAGSNALGMEFCTGCWLEGGDRFGDVEAGLRWCSEQGRICLVHFRNVSAPLPNFTEAFLDNGYKDMYPLMKILVEKNYKGTVTLDHSPRFSSYAGKGSGTAYAIGYMRALLERAEAECERENAL